MTIESILNFRRLDDRITTSGQPSEAQIAALAADGVTTVINLGLHSHERALPDEAASVAAAGMRYIHIPVPFDTPGEDHFVAFSQAMAATEGEQVHVHCIMNMRVTAFLDRWSREQGHDANAARAMMDSVWQPGGPWASLIGDQAGAARGHLGPRG